MYNETRKEIGNLGRDTDKIQRQNLGKYQHLTGRKGTQSYQNKEISDMKKTKRLV